MKLIAAAIFATFLMVTSALSQGQIIYNSIPSPLPGNVSSVGFEATGTSEFGDRIGFSANSGRKLLTVSQTMSSWGCQAGHWYSGDCFSATGATFSHPITLNIYAVGAGNQPGALIGSVTQTFQIPYRPSASIVCGDGRWSNGSHCYNGYATTITFDVSSIASAMPNQVIYGIAYNTTHYGYQPIGEATACFTTVGGPGCPYDSLNVALEGSLSVGSDPSVTDLYEYTFYNGCTTTGAVMPFGLDSCDWTGYTPVPATFTASNVPSDANQCKNGGWQSRTRADGSFFKNQGDCVSFTQNGK